MSVLPDADDLRYEQVVSKIIAAQRQKEPQLHLNYALPPCIANRLREKHYEVHVDTGGGCSHHFCNCDAGTIIRWS